MTRLHGFAAGLALGAVCVAACGSSGGSHGQMSGGSGGRLSARAGAPSGGSEQGRGGSVSEAGASEAGASVGNGGASGNPSAAGSLGSYPFAPSPTTRGGTMTFRNVGAPGFWPRRIDRPAGDAACDYKDGTDTWGAHCCMKQQATDSNALAPFDEEMTLILKAIDVKQLAIYQPESGAAGADSWRRVTDWDRRAGGGSNLWFTQKGDGSATFPGDLTKNDCVGYLSQAPLFPCGDGSNYYCPKDPGVLHRGFSGSKLIVLLASMTFDDAGVAACDGNGAGHPGPWLAFVASELIRDGGRKWNGACNCYSKTGSIGDGCGEINVFEVVMDNNDYSNREFASTGVRSYQAGHVGGAVCGVGCDRKSFATDVEVVDACAKKAYSVGPELVIDGDTDGCPVWRRPDGDRYFFILLDERERAIQVGVIHPSAVPAQAAALLPQLPAILPRSTVDALLALRLPE
jgi:hypothetical protein